MPCGIQLLLCLHSGLPVHHIFSMEVIENSHCYVRVIFCCVIICWYNWQEIADKYSEQLLPNFLLLLMGGAESIKGMFE